MSGIEAVGVVLGALPLLVAAFTVQHETRNLIYRIRRPERVIQSLRNRLGTQHHVFKDTTKTLLREVFGEAIAHELVRNLKSEKWKDPELTNKMREYLAGRYENWIAIVDEVNASIREIQTQLQFDPDDVSLVYSFQMSPPMLTCSKDSSVPSLAVDVAQRLKTAFGKSKIDKTLASIESDVSLPFKRLTSGARRLAIKTAQRNGDPPDFKQLRVAARRTYETVSSKISCLCRSSHVLCLGLDLVQSDDAWIGKSTGSLRRGQGVVLATRSKPADQPQYVGHIEVPATIDGQIEQARVQTGLQRDTLDGSDEKCLKSLIHSGAFASSTGINPLLKIAKQELPHVIAVDTLFTSSRYTRKGSSRFVLVRKLHYLLLLVSYNFTKLLGSSNRTSVSK